MGNGIEITNVKDFCLRDIFDCGQCFRWENVKDGAKAVNIAGANFHGNHSLEGELGEEWEIWRGIAGNRVATISYNCYSELLRIEEDGAEVEKQEELFKFWRRYFDLDRDYGKVKRMLVGEPGAEGYDLTMAKAIEAGEGIRILKQDSWETLLSFIISQNNNIPRIKKCINSLAETLGEEVADGYYALPSPEVLARASEEDLAMCRLGYRAKYLIETARQVMEGVSLKDLERDDISSAEATERLLGFCGVGPIVANCIALFGLAKIDSFPIDVWMRRVMNRLYGLDEKNTKAMMEYAQEHFAPYGGIAQQYLFNYITKHKE